jgi:DNA-binding IclR family transcriptional regulator
VPALNSLEKMLSLLDVFTQAAPVWSTDDLIRYSGSSRSTCYRYLKVLQDSGLLTPVAGGSYILGPRIIELDRNVRLSDPVYTGGGPPMAKLVNKTRLNAVLCILFSDTVMCVRDFRHPDAPESMFSRGQRRPLFVGAASKVMLPYLPAHQQRALYAKHAKGIAAAGLGADWDGFRKSLAQIREAGHCITQGEFSPGIVGIAAPLFNAAGHVLGSMGLVFHHEKMARAEFPKLAKSVMKAAQEATERISSGAQGVDLPARAVG